MSEPKKLDLRSMDIAKEQKEKLRQLFPEVFTEDKIDFDKLKLTLGENVEAGKERYGMTWPGKADCFKVIQSPSIGTLKPCREESVNFDTTENLFIEGDNLEVLKLLQKSYYGKIKMIYIDPPYNTGKEFIYPDDYKENLTTYLQYTGQVDAEGKKFSTNADTEGRFHSKWLNMMYPRLFLAKNLLRDDGVIFISIDDNEVDNLKKICNEIFGEENFIALLPTIMNLKGNQDQHGFAGTHEYTLVFTKNKEQTRFGYFRIVDEDISEWDKDEWGYFKKGANLKATGVNAPRDKRPNLFFPLYINKQNLLKTVRESDDDIEVFPITDGKEMSWRWEKIKFEREPHNIIVERTRDGNISIYKKQRPDLGDLPSRKPKTLFYKPEYSSGNGTQQLKEIFNVERILDNPKPVDLIRDLIEISGDKNAIILDFFAGSCTTAHAVLDLNKEDGGRRKFIMVQLPEPCDGKSEAYKAGFKTIADIGKERIRRVIKKIQEEQKKDDQKTLFDKSDGKKPLDLGFKVFKLDKSNFKIWDGENIPKDKKSLERQLELHIDHISPKATQEDILFEILLKAGFELTTKIEKIDLAGKTVYSIEDGAMLVCLERELTKEVIKAMAEKSPSRVICLDQGFANNDQLKTNAVQIMTSKGVDDFRTV